MAMAVDSRQQLSMGGMPYDQMRYTAAPEFTNPWTAANQSTHLYGQQQLPPVTSGFDDKVSRPTSIPQSYSMAPTAGAPSTGFVGPARSYQQDYPLPVTTQPSSFIPTTSAPFASQYSHPPLLHDYQDARPAYSQRAPQQGREAFGDAIDASRGMVAMSQTDLTPRPIYGHDNARQGAHDAYGFPTTHSAHSSISSASSYPYQYGSSVGSSISGSIAGSVDGSVTDYSSAGEEVMGSRTLPRPTGYISGSLPPAASSMMSQFNSKVSPSTQKKHKCKICDKRFTRPSSLQTHMYSHTGEKPFACDIEGCGRHFSVVSNLRRHKKVHRGENDQGSPDAE